MNSIGDTMWPSKSQNYYIIFQFDIPFFVTRFVAVKTKGCSSGTI